MMGIFDDIPTWAKPQPKEPEQPAGPTPEEAAAKLYEELERKAQEIFLKGNQPPKRRGRPPKQKEPA